MFCNRAIYHDGWMASSRLGTPWTRESGPQDFESAPWELYNLEEDCSQATDLARENPGKLAELKALFVAEAEKYGVFPLDPRFSERMDPKLRVGGESPRRWSYFGNRVELPEPIGPQLFPRPFAMTATLEVPQGGADGVVACAGAFSAGWSLYVLEGRPRFRYTFFDIADVTIPGTVALPEGRVALRAEFRPDGTKGGGGTLTLFVDGRPAGEGKLARSAFRHGLEPFEVGRDSITPVSPDYRGRGTFEFGGRIERVDFELLD
jgi:arylsulfatase